MRNIKITDEDLSRFPEAQFSLITPIAAGWGWLPLVCEVLEGLPAGVRVTQIKEKYGALKIHTVPSRGDHQGLLETAKSKSLKVCEICGKPGALRHDGDWMGTPDEPSGWLRVRCDVHADYRVYAGAYIPEDDLQERERARRACLEKIKSHVTRGAALCELMFILPLDVDFPIGEAAHLSSNEIRDLVPVTVTDGFPPYIREIDIPEPWATRLSTALTGQKHQLGGYYVEDWNNFLDLWDQEDECVNEALGNHEND